MSGYIGSLFNSLIVSERGKLGLDSMAVGSDQKVGAWRHGLDYILRHYVFGEP